MNEIVKEDLRVTKTKKALREALLELITEKEFDKISVTEICDRALVNRMTFYKYYNDKFDLLDYLFSTLSISLVNKVKELESKSDDPLDIIIETIKEAYKFCLDNIEPLTSIASQCNTQIINTLSKVCLSHLNTLFENLAAKKGYEYPIEQISVFVFGGFGSLLYFWLTNREAYTLEKISKELDGFKNVIKKSNLLK